MLAYMRKVVSLVLSLIFLCTPLTASAMSFEEERTIAREIITLLDSQGLIVYDQEITWPVKMVTDRLADHVKDPIYTFQVHVVMDKSI
ncbi:MAG TPA: hypothetical protein P5146_05870, partial [Desulfomonilia bacterium]|nr:hypothetical protein [Desulfomonilia bacterium]